MCHHKRPKRGALESYCFFREGPSVFTVFRACTETVSPIWNFYSLNLSLRSSTYTVINPGFRKRLRKLSKKVVDLHGSRPAIIWAFPIYNAPTLRPTKLTDHQLSSYPGWKYGVSASKERAADIILRQISETSPGGMHGFRNFWWRNLENKFSKKRIHYTPIHPISCEDRCLEPITSRTSGDV